MIADKMKPLMANNSAIRTMFEEGDKMRAEFGAENVYDFSLGNPDAPVPDEIKQAVIDILNEEDPGTIHGYMSNAGFEDVREAIAQSLNRRVGTSVDSGNILMTVGAASGLNVAFKTRLNPGEEVIIFAPYFLEYNWYVDNYDGKVVQAPTDKETFYPDLESFEKLITDKTRVVLINTPNNPTGVIYSEETIKQIADILNRKQRERRLASLADGALKPPHIVPSAKFIAGMVKDAEEGEAHALMKARTALIGERHASIGVAYMHLTKDLDQCGIEGGSEPGSPETGREIDGELRIPLISFPFHMTMSIGIPHKSSLLFTD